MSRRVRVGVLGATGVVGQHLVRLLEHHPFFELTAVAASDRSVGRPYGEACRWLVSAEMPASARTMTVAPCEPGLDCELVFSGLPSDVAGPVELAFAAAGYAVSSNAGSHRMADDVPLLVPEVNPDHLAMLDGQRARRGWGRGFIVTNPNCSTIQLVIVLRPLLDRFGLERVSVVTLQALSGAGYPGVPSLDALDNVIPFIRGEEEKIESEPGKLLGTLAGGTVRPAPFAISAQCHRVSVRDGHMEAVSVRLGRKGVSVADVVEALESFRGVPQQLALPSAPRHPIIVMREDDRPQPLLDRDREGGMAVTVGRVRECPVLGFKLSVLGHNTVRGAAGAALLNAELLRVRGYLTP